MPKVSNNFRTRLLLSHVAGCVCVSWGKANLNLTHNAVEAGLSRVRTGIK